MLSSRGNTRRAPPCLAVVLLTLTCLQAAASAPPGVEDEARARTNYMLNCQGCHGVDGAGNASGDVPLMKGFVGRFLQVPGGREFLVQVPGSANAALTDAALAELLNWMLFRISASELPAGFLPYTGEEVGRLRKTPEADVVGRRAALVREIERLAGPAD